MLKEMERPACNGFGNSRSFTTACIDSKVDLQAFLRSKGRKSCICRYTVDAYSGKVAFVRFPPVWAEENLQTYFSFHLPFFCFLVGSQVGALVNTMIDGHVNLMFKPYTTKSQRKSLVCSTYFTGEVTWMVKYKERTKVKVWRNQKERE